MKKIFILMLIIVLNSCSKPENLTVEQQTNKIAQEYTFLVLACGKYDKDYVDAYFGPDSLKTLVEQEKLSLSAINKKAIELDSAITKLNFDSTSTVFQQRAEYLKGMIKSLVIRSDMLNGKKLNFDDECHGLYNTLSPPMDEYAFDMVLAKLDKKLPGKGKLDERFLKFRADFIVPKDKLPAIFDAAVAEARKRTLQYIDLPYEEKFKIEYVTDVSWGAYNWYKGNGFSLIQVNQDLPFYIDRAIDLACHEGFPGHHIYHSMLDNIFLKDSNWIEFSVYPLFSPQATISEGLANAGISVAFPKQERIEFEKNVLFPLAGLDNSRVEEYYEILDILAELEFAGNSAARAYLNGEKTEEETAQWLMKYKLRSYDHAKNNIRFYDQYGAYVINYNVGQKLIEDHIAEKLNDSKDHAKRWQYYYELLSQPLLPSML